jgi:hypothetical protein
MEGVPPEMLQRVAAELALENRLLAEICNDRARQLVALTAENNALVAQLREAHGESATEPDSGPGGPVSDGDATGATDDPARDVRAAMGLPS